MRPTDSSPRVLRRLGHWNLGAGFWRRFGAVLAPAGLLVPIVFASCGTSSTDTPHGSTDAGGEGAEGGDGSGGSGASGGSSDGRSGEGGSGGATGGKKPIGSGGEAGAGTDEACTPTGPEECDGLDNDCNGLIDDGLGVEVRRASDGFIVEEAEACDRPDDADDCALGRYKCQAGAVVCDEKDGRDPVTGEGGEEICDGKDNNCDGQIDEGFGVDVLDAINGAVLVPAQPCDGPDADLCAEGFWQCDAFGAAVCSDTTGSNAELCNKDSSGNPIDDDCNPDTNQEDLPALGSCTTECGVGQLQCTNGEWLCSAAAPSEPSCANPTADLDCNGIPDGEQQGVEGAVPHYLDDDDDGYPVDSGPLLFCNNGSPRGKYKVARADGKWDCCDADKDAHPGQKEYFDHANHCGSWDYDCSGSDDKKATVEDTGVPHKQCFQSCLDKPTEGQSGWDGILCGTCDPSCGRVCPHVMATQCIFPPTNDKKVLCR